MFVSVNLHWRRDYSYLGTSARFLPDEILHVYLNFTCFKNTCHLKHNLKYNPPIGIIIQCRYFIFLPCFGRPPTIFGKARHYAMLSVTRVISWMHSSYRSCSLTVYSEWVLMSPYRASLAPCLPASCLRIS